MYPENFDLICRNIQRNLTILSYKLELVRMSYGIEMTLEGFRVSDKHLLKKAKEYSPDSFSLTEDIRCYLLRKSRRYSNRFLKYKQVVLSACKELDSLYNELQEKTILLKKVSRTKCPDSVVDLLKDVDDFYSRVNGTFPVLDL